MKTKTKAQSNLKTPATTKKTIVKKTPSVKAKDTTSAQRTANLKQRLIADGGKRMSINLNGDSVKTLDAYIKAGYGTNHSDVIRKLIEENA
jgi:hypothetical protein